MEAEGRRVDRREDRIAGGSTLELAVFFAGNVCVGAGLFIHAFSFNFYLRDLGYTAAVMGHQVTAMTAGGLLALLPAGVAIDRFGTRRTMLGGVAIATVGLAISALVHASWLIQAMAVLIGIGGATCRVSWGPAIMQLTTDARRARAFTWNVALLVGTGALWTILAGAVSDAHRQPVQLGHGAGLSGTQLALLGGAALTALALLCYGFLHLPHLSRGVHAAKAVPAAALPKDMRALIALIAAWMLASALVLPFFNIFFADRFTMRIASVGSLFAGAHVANALLLIAAAEVARRRGPRRALTWWMTALAPSLWALAAVNSLPLAALLFLVQGLVAPATNPLIDQLVLERVDATRRGIVAGWRNAAAEVAGGLGASLGGHLVDATSFNVLFIVAGSVAAITSVPFIAMLRATPNRASLPLDVDVAEATRDPA